MTTTLPQTATLETERLFIQEITSELYDYLYTHWDDEKIRQFIGWETQQLYEEETKKYRGGFKTHRTSYRFFLIKEKATNRLIGRAGFHNHFPEHNRTEMGYNIIKEEDKNKGYMKESLKAILQYGFEEMKLNRIEAFLSPLNTPSLRLVEHFGFTREGLLKQHWYKNGIMEDSAVYGLLKPEYEMIKQGW